MTTLIYYNIKYEIQEVDYIEKNLLLKPNTSKTNITKILKQINPQIRGRQVKIIRRTPTRRKLNFDLEQDLSAINIELKQGQTARAQNIKLAEQARKLEQKLATNLRRRRRNAVEIRDGDYFENQILHDYITAGFQLYDIEQIEVDEPEDAALRTRTLLNDYFTRIRRRFNRENLMEIQFKFVCSVRTEHGPEMTKIFDVAIENGSITSRISKAVDSLMSQIMNLPSIRYVSLTEIRVLVIQPNQGGCDELNEHTVRVGNYKVFSSKTKDNNCLFGSIKHQLEIKAIERKLPRYSYQIRNKLKIELGTPINFNQLEMIAKYYNIKINVMHLDVNGVLFNTTQYGNSTDEITLVWYIAHFTSYVCDYYEANCAKCCRWYNINNIHVCNQERVQKCIDYAINRDKKSCKSRFQLRTKAFDFNRVLHYDLETGVLPNKQHVARSVGYTYLGETHIIHDDDKAENMGKCINKFLDVIHDLTVPVILNAYNGSGYDVSFLLSELTNDARFDIKDLIPDNGGYIKLSFKRKDELCTGCITWNNKTDAQRRKDIKDCATCNNVVNNVKEKFITCKQHKSKCKNCKIYPIHKTFDLYRFTLASLDSTLKAFGCNVTKGEFDYTLLDAPDVFNDIEVKEKHDSYLKKDVEGLSEVFMKFQNQMYDKKGIWITDYVTLSDMSYCIFSEIYNDNDIYTPTQEEYEFITNAIYGGRCYPVNEQFKSNDINKAFDFMLRHLV